MASRSIFLKVLGLSDTKKCKKFEIITKKENKDDIYIQKVKLNGKEWNSFKFPVKYFYEGGKLEIELGPQPNYNWGIDPS